MLKIGDKVEIIGKTFSVYGEPIEHIPVGTITKVVHVGTEPDGKFFYVVTYRNMPFYYPAESLQNVWTQNETHVS